VIAVLALTLLVATLVFELSELAVAFVGAGIYYLVKKVNQQQPVRRKGEKLKAEPRLASDAESCHALKATFDMPRSRPAPGTKAPRAVNKDIGNVLSCTVKPVDAPVFLSSGFEAEVGELLDQLAPTAEAEIAVNRLVDIVKQAILPRIPGAEIVGFASGNPMQSKAFGVALPDIDVVINASPVVLARCLEGRLTRGGAAAVRNDPHKLQKAALRACTDELVSVTDLKFRRSGFKGEYPKVTLLAPAAVTGVSCSMGLDLSINAATPLHNALLLTECGHMEPRAKELIMLVRRWTRDRGVAHAAKGHLSHYGWSLLTIYFLQVHETADGVLLPRLDCFEKSASLLPKRNEEEKWKPAAKSNISVAALFKEFVRFYNTEFDWRKEAASVRLGRRAAPSLALPLHVMEGPSATLAPSIEDPFDVKRNVATCMTASGLLRMREELTRAEDLLKRSGSLAELLAHWVPPDASGGSGQHEDVCEGEAA
jgi:DNA polymerase sigma